MEHLHCFKTDERVASIHLCMDKYIIQMESLGDMPSDQTIASTCCSFHMLKKCIKDKAMELCDQKETIDYVENLETEVVSAVGDICAQKHLQIESLKY